MTTIFWISFGLLWILVAIQGFAFLEVLRQVGQIRRELGPKQGALIIPDTVEAGAPLPEMSGLSMFTLQPANWTDYLGTKFGLVVCLSTHCLSCRSMAEDLTGFAFDVKNDANVLALIDGPIADVQTFVKKTGLDPRMVIIDEGGITTRRLGISWTPGALTVREGKIGEAAIVNTIPQLGSLVYGKIVAPDGATVSASRGKVQDVVPT